MNLSLSGWFGFRWLKILRAASKWASLASLDNWIAFSLSFLISSGGWLPSCSSCLRSALILFLSASSRSASSRLIKKALEQFARGLLAGLYSTYFGIVNLDHWLARIKIWYRRQLLHCAHHLLGEEPLFSLFQEDQWLLEQHDCMIRI